MLSVFIYSVRPVFLSRYSTEILIWTCRKIFGNKSKD